MQQSCWTLHVNTRACAGARWQLKVHFPPPGSCSLSPPVQPGIPHVQVESCIVLNAS